MMAVEIFSSFGDRRRPEHHDGLALSLAYTWYKILRETGLALPPKNLIRDLLVVS